MGFENGKVVEVKLRMFKAATIQQEQVVLLHYDLEDVTGEPANDPQTLADLFRDNVLPSFKALFTNAWSNDVVVVQETIDPLNKTKPRGSWQSGVVAAGTYGAAGDLLPQACCGYARILTGKLGRRFNGRMFVPGTYAEVDQANGTYNAAAVLRMQTFLDAIPRQPDIQSGISASTAVWSVYSRTQRLQNLDPYLMAVTAAQAQSKVHFLRSRDV